MALRSTVGTGGVRDPSLVRSPDGSRYWIIATDLCIGCGRSWGDSMSNGSRILVVWESTDLVTWSQRRLLNAAGAIPGGRNAWAPEAIWNPATNDYVLYWATSATLNGVLKHRIYYARTTDFRAVTARSSTSTAPAPRTSSTPRSSKCRPVSATTARPGRRPDVDEVPRPQRVDLYLDQYTSGRGYTPVTTTNPVGLTLSSCRRPEATAWAAPPSATARSSTDGCRGEPCTGPLRRAHRPGISGPDAEFRLRPGPAWRAPAPSPSSRSTSPGTSCGTPDSTSSSSTTTAPPRSSPTPPFVGSPGSTRSAQRQDAATPPSR